jgi:hypothetical protein
MDFLLQKDNSRPQPPKKIGTFLPPGASGNQIPNPPPFNPKPIDPNESSSANQNFDRYPGQGTHLALDTRNRRLRHETQKLTQKQATMKNRNASIGMGQENIFLIPGMQTVPYSDAELQVAFESIDHRKLGFLNPDAIRDALYTVGETSASEDEIAGMIRLVDADGGQEISFDEFKKLFIDPPTLFRNYDTSDTHGQRVRSIAMRAKSNQQAVRDAGKIPGGTLPRERVLEIMGEMFGGTCGPPQVKRLYQNFIMVDWSVTTRLFCTAIFGFFRKCDFAAYFSVPL